LNTGFRSLLFVIQLPSEILTLALTVAMGLLGSTIHMSRQMFLVNASQAKAPSLLWFIARPLEGVASAIIIYIFFRAGQLTLTGSGSGENPVDELNPYVLSFLAIASGLLSEDAYSRITKGARRMLGTDGARDEDGSGPPVLDRPSAGGPADGDAPTPARSPFEPGAPDAPQPPRPAG
jgi:hypothetical protein